MSASGDASNRLIAGGNVAAIDPSLFSEFENVIGPLQVDGSNNAHYVVDGKVYGTPYMYGPNFLMYNTDVVKPAPTSWDITWEPTRRTLASSRRTTRRSSSPTRRCT